MVLVPREPTPEMLANFWAVANGQHPMDERPWNLTKRQMRRATAAYARMIAAAPAAPGFDDIAVHCQQAGCQFLNPLPEPVRVDEAMAERLRIAFYPLLENIKRCHIKDALTAALAPNGGKEKL
jgi:hypothetical protein